jgi:hypothetical protein
VSTHDNVHITAFDSLINGSFLLALDRTGQQAYPYAKGFEEGLEEGRDEERRLNAALAAALASEGREGEIAGAMADPRVRDRLLEELGIE